MGPEGDTVTVAEQLLNTEYWVLQPARAAQGAHHVVFIAQRGGLHTLGFFADT